MGFIDDERKEGFVSSFIVRTFICPICEVDLENKRMFILHMYAQHPKEYRNMNFDKLDELEDFKAGKSDVLNL